ncbi:hypothetical protein ABIF50_003322 [Bradyrhizobium diazoefficiens]
MDSRHFRVPASPSEADLSDSIGYVSYPSAMNSLSEAIAL